MKKLAVWLDHNLLLLATAVLLVAVPAWPKLPLADLIEGYIVRLRFEDIAVLLTTIIWGVQLIRGRIQLPKGPLFKLIVAYLVVGFLSSLSAMFITHTVPLEEHHIFKLYLHYFRRIEYFSLFFVAYSAVRTKKDLRLLLITSLVTFCAVLLYGFGQKYLLWPAFSTMNREFSKGIRLYLSPNSRVMSTFAGHYDYAAYLMMALTFLAALFWLVKNYWVKLGLFLIFAASYWSLILTASRTSFLGYLAGVTLVAVLLVKIKGFWRMLGNWTVLMVLSFAVMLTLGDLSERFFSILREPDILAHDLTRFLPVRRETVNRTLGYLGVQMGGLETKINSFKDLAQSPVKTPPPGSKASDDLSKVTTPSDELPTARPPDVSKEEDELRRALEATKSATPVQGEYSPNALKYGLSIAIRLDALWPRAIAGFKRNPLLGSGYSTLVKADNEEFTQAESTDNDYLRMLGETGLLGTATYLASLIVVIGLSLRLYHRSQDPVSKALGLGMAGSVVALLVNATYIDIFESSKVAYILWGFSAITLRALELSKAKK